MANKRSSLRSEDSDQEAVIEYCEIRGIPIVHIPNEGKRTVSYGAKLRRMGMKKGFPDLFIPKAAKGKHGLFIEMKAPRGRVTAEQDEWLSLLSREGYGAVVCYGFNKAISVIEAYLKGG